MNILDQNTMSAKHILNTNSDSLAFVDEFDNYFTFSDGFRILLRDDIEEFDNIEILINRHLVDKDKDVDDLEYNEYIPEFILHNVDTDERIIIKDTNGSAFYMANSVFKEFNTKRKKGNFDDEGFVSISMSKLSTENEIFFVRLKNDELTKPLSELKKLIEKGKEIDANGVSELITRLRYLMRCGGIDTESIHVEILALNLIRSAHDILQKPDWSKPNPEYQITSIQNAIMMSDSVISTLTFERLNQQLQNPLTYKKRGTSSIDRLFILE